MLDDIRASIDFLNDETNMQNADQIQQHWAATYEYRRKEISKRASEAINDWLPLRQDFGAILVRNR